VDLFTFCFYESVNNWLSQVFWLLPSVPNHGSISRGEKVLLAEVSPLNKRSATIAGNASRKAIWCDIRVLELIHLNVLVLVFNVTSNLKLNIFDLEILDLLTLEIIP
jgi:hypothetical protein